MFDKVTNEYTHALAGVYHRIDKRGLLFDVPAVDKLRQEVTDEIRNLCTILSTNWSMLVYVGNIESNVCNGSLSKTNNTVNINSSSGNNSLLNTLKRLGYNVPVVRKRNADKEWEMKESADELALQKMFADCGDVNLKHLMRIKELVKLLGTYINARLHRGVFYSSYGVASTVTGRRGCSKHPFGFGGNAQTFPSHTTDKFTHDFRRCIIARPGCIFFSVDQKSAEDWPVSALAGNQHALKELSATTWPENDRHTKLASFVFGVPVNTYTKQQWKDTSHQAGTMRYVGGKKARHANNYGMRKNRFSEVLAKEGFSFTPKACETILEKVNQFDPLVESVFHSYVKEQITQTRMLVTPLGRERQFLGFRPNSDNWEVWNEAYAYIPQSTIGDNTGMAVLHLDQISQLPFVVQEGHDSIVQEVPDELRQLESVFTETENSFDRTLTFYNGISVKIPIEAELSYNFEDKVSLRDYTIDDLRTAYKELKEKYDTRIEREVQTI